MASENFRFVCDEDDIGKRIDQVIAGKLDRTRSFCNGLIKKGYVKVNDDTVKPSYKIKHGDVIETFIPEEKPLTLEPVDIKLDIVYENEFYIVVNKQPGLCVHPAPGNESNTLVNALINKIEGDESFRPGIVHRLDKDTSGLILVTKKRVVKEKIAELFKSRKVEKKYFAICYGNPRWEHKIIETKIGRHPVERKRMSVTEDGRYAKTEVWILKRFKNVFLADIKIYTGRTHQIRVHMAHVGFPLVGDQVYGSKLSRKIGFPRQALHSYYLSFECPFEKKKMTFQIDLYKDMREFIDNLTF